MDQKQDKALFPGQKTGLIRVFIKRVQEEESTQLHFWFWCKNKVKKKAAYLFLNGIMSYDASPNN
ncbi:hypothetical protein [Peribacillus asahii]|uniref:hypothetical protein n=1 Tax=Peribacillus asahii TaxID=228899 RepID=UPI002079CFC6|nr:hypothetical protein [Peribacillus asahii]USK62362.1 hypothetical protein LIT37_22970 [Peribacillus asahii]